MSEIKHSREEIDRIIKKMKDARDKGEKLSATLKNVSTVIQSEFSGKAQESLAALIELEVKKINKEKENWQILIEQTENIASSMEDQDEKLSTAVQSNTQLLT